MKYPRLENMVRNAATIDAVNIPNYPIKLKDIYSIQSSMQQKEGETILRVNDIDIKNGFARIQPEDREKTKKLFLSFLRLKHISVEKDEETPKNKGSKDVNIYEKTAQFVYFFNNFFSLYEGDILPFDQEKKELFYQGTRKALELAVHSYPIKYMPSVWDFLLHFKPNFISKWIDSLNHLKIKSKGMKESIDTRLFRYLRFSTSGISGESDLHYQLLDFLGKGDELYVFESFAFDFLRDKKLTTDEARTYVKSFKSVPYSARQGFELCRMHFLEVEKDNEKVNQLLYALINASQNKPALYERESDILKNIPKENISTIESLLRIVKKDDRFLNASLSLVDPITPIPSYIANLEAISKLSFEEFPYEERLAYASLSAKVVKDYCYRERHSIKETRKREDDVSDSFTNLLQRFASQPSDIRNAVLENINAVLSHCSRSSRLSYLSWGVIQLAEPILESSIIDKSKTKEFVKGVLAHYHDLKHIVH